MNLIDSIDRWIDTNPLFGGIVTNVTAAGLIALIAWMLNRTEWLSIGRNRFRPVQRGLTWVEGHAPNRPRLKYAEPLFWLAFFGGVLAVGLIFTWRIPLGAFLALQSIGMFLAGLALLIGGDGPAGRLYRDVKSGLVFTALGIAMLALGMGLLLASELYTAIGLLAAGIAFLSLAAAFVAEVSVGLRVGNLTEAVGNLHSSRVAGGADFLAWGAALTTWGITFLLQSTARGGTGLIALGASYIAGSIAIFVEYEVSERAKSDVSLIPAGLFRLAIGIGFVSWGVAIISDNSQAAYAALLATGIGFISLAVGFFLVHQFARGVTSQLIGLGLLILAVSNALDSTLTPLGTASAGAIAAGLSAAITVWAMNHSSDPRASLAYAKLIYDERSESLGAEHRKTLLARRNLASAHRSLGEVDDALSIDQDLYQTYQKILGSDHPESLASQRNLGVSQRVAGAYKDAVKTHEAVRAACQNGNAPLENMISIEAELAASYRTAGLFDEAERLESKVWQDSQRLFGPHHPTTKRALQIHRLRRATS